jgi:hypothetical protein
MYATVKELREPLRAALAAVGYGGRDVELVPATTVDPTVGGGDGMRGFVTVVNLDTGVRQTVNGSWGGSNPFSHSPVDQTTERIELPPNGAVVKGTRGYPRTFATVYAHPSAVGANLLPSGAPADDVLTDADQQALYCFAAIKGGEYRRDEMRRRGVTEEQVNSLVLRGYLKRNKAGATQITTKGKNARDTRIW